MCRQKCEGRQFAHTGECPICGERLLQIDTSCSVQESIAQRIHLILITGFGEFRYDTSFGCLIWEHDFENVPNLNKWRDEMAQSIKLKLLQFEKRLTNVQLTLDLTEEEFKGSDGDHYRKIKRRVDIRINANLKKTNEPFYFQELLYVSPVWIE